MPKKKSIEDMHMLAQRNQGECISPEYVNNSSKLRWRCKDGHEFEAIPGNVQQGKWCPECARARSGSSQRLALEDAQKSAIERGGVCLSDKYINSQTKLRWRCELGHEFGASANYVRSGHWCPTCARTRSGGTQRLTLKEIHLLAEQRGGKCFAAEYRNTGQKVLWECAAGHQWTATVGSVRGSGTWCPYCSQGVSEQICRAILENAFGQDFPKHRPKWLINSLGNRMELDGCCANLGLAFEYNGEQHYIKHRAFHGASKTLDRRIADDQLKVKLCRTNGVALIVIPYTVIREELGVFIFEECKRLGFDAPKESFQWDPLDIAHANTKKFFEIQSVARKNGGECLSEAYIDSKTKMRFKCVEGHEWSAVPQHLISGVWCPTCGRKNAAQKITKYDIATLQGRAEEKGGKCVSNEYLGATELHEWECAQKHRWRALPYQVLKGTWCPTCAKSGRASKYTIGHFKELARAKGGECLSEKYDGIFGKLKWRCKHGHEWDATAKSIQDGRWCRKCWYERLR